MNIDLTKLITSNLEELEIKGNVEIPEEQYQNTSIRELKNVTFDGEVLKLYDNSYQITGNLQGIMILPDDITLENVEYPFQISIEEKFSEINNFEENNLKIIQNGLDITDFLWQNILVEIPLKVKLEKNENLTLKGNGWRLVTENELENENDNGNNSPFSELSKIFESRKE